MTLINWFQIPVTDIDRAVKFYEFVCQTSLQRFDDARMKRAFFPMEPGNQDRTGGEIVQSPDDRPSVDGVTIYLNAPGGVDAAVERTLEAGGKIAVPKMSIGEHGFIALVIDTEGNQIGLHAMS
jgi:uncharacterized protein